MTPTKTAPIRALLGPPWRPSSRDTERYSVLNWQELAGLRIKRSTKGNIIHSATCNGAPLSQTQARKLAAVRVWVEVEDESVQVSGDPPSECSREHITAAVEEAL